MKDKMRSFLNHIHIDNVDDFDIDFELVRRNRFNYQQIDMIILKNSPWQYDLLYKQIKQIAPIVGKEIV